MLKPKAESHLIEPGRRQIIEDSLPLTISKVEVQQSNSSRVSIFADDKFLFGLPLRVANECNLTAGKVMDRRLLTFIESESIRYSVRSWLLSLLAKKNYTRKQLFDKCSSSGYDAEVVNEILDEFEQKKWLNEAEYAAAFVRDKSSLNRWGPGKIRHKLSELGVNKGFGDAAIRDNVSAEDQIEAIRQLVSKRRNHYLREEDLTKRRKKIIDYLLRKGYDSSIVFDNIDKLMQLLQK
jgi:regulatory protein